MCKLDLKRYYFLIFCYYSNWSKNFLQEFSGSFCWKHNMPVNRLDFMSKLWWLCTSWAPKSCQKRMSFHSRKYPSIVTNRVSPNVCLQRGRWGGSNKVGPHCSNIRENVFSWLSVLSLNHTQFSGPSGLCLQIVVQLLTSLHFRTVLKYFKKEQFLYKSTGSTYFYLIWHNLTEIVEKFTSTKQGRCNWLHITVRHRERSEWTKLYQIRMEEKKIKSPTN